MENRFAPAEDIFTRNTDYSHGYSDEEVEKIKQNETILRSRDLVLEPTTLTEFIEIVIPSLRIKRTEVFKLQEDKPVKTQRETKAPKEPKSPKTKKLTKKQQNSLLHSIAMKQITGEALTKDEQILFNSLSNDLPDF